MKKEQAKEFYLFIMTNFSDNTLVRTLKLANGQTGEVEPFIFDEEKLLLKVTNPRLEPKFFKDDCENMPTKINNVLKKIFNFGFTLNIKAEGITVLKKSADLMLLLTDTNNNGLITVIPPTAKATVLENITDDDAILYYELN